MFHHSIDIIPFWEVYRINSQLPLDEIIDLYHTLGKAYHEAEKKNAAENGDNTADYWKARYDALSVDWKTETSYLRNNINDLKKQIIQLKFPDGLVKAALSNYDVVYHAHHGKKIEAIKAFRTLTGCSLKEAKDAIESQEFLANYESSYKSFLPSPKTPKENPNG